MDVVERSGNRDLEPRTTVAVHTEGGPADRRRARPHKPQLICALTRQLAKTADREMSSAIHGDEKTGARLRLPRTPKDHDSTGPTGQRFDLGAGGRPRRAAHELALKRDVPDQERRQCDSDCRPSRETQPPDER